MNYKVILIFCSLFVISFVHATFEHPHKVADHQALCEQYKALPQNQKIIWGSLIFGNLLASLFEQMLEQHVELFNRREKRQSLDELIPKLKENYYIIDQFYKNIVFFSHDGIVDKDKFEQVIDHFISFYLQSRDQQILNSLEEVEAKFKELEQRGFAVADVFDRSTNKRRAVEALHVFNVSKLLSNPKPGYFSSVSIDPIEITIQIPYMEQINEPSLLEEVSHWLLVYYEEGSRQLLLEYMKEYNVLRQAFLNGFSDLSEFKYEKYLKGLQNRLAVALKSIKPMSKHTRRAFFAAVIACLATHRFLGDV